MRKLLAGIIAATFLITVGVVSAPGEANAGRVNGYYRSNGTYVDSYYRSSPNAYKFDNYSYSGGSLYNNSYSSPTRNYTSTWYTPSYLTQPDYYTGLNSYRSSRSSPSRSYDWSAPSYRNSYSSLGSTESRSLYGSTYGGLYDW